MGTQADLPSFSNIPPRDKGFLEQTLDSIQEMDLKQILSIPLSASLNTAAGALQGLTFGTVDLTDDVREALGGLAPPEPLQSAQNIAGELAGGFAVFGGASKVARAIFKGAALGEKVARGAFTFGAPELLRQGVNQDLDPKGLLRSVATGGAFSLPLARGPILSRALLAPVVAGTELAFGAEPIEAGAAALFAGIFGPLEGPRRAEAVKRLKDVTINPALGGGGTIPEPELVNKLKLPKGVKEAILGPTPPKVQQPLPSGGRGEELKRLAGVRKPKQLRLPLTPADEMRKVAETVDEASKLQIDKVANTVDQLALRGPTVTAGTFQRSLEQNGPTSGLTFVAHHADAQAKGMYVPPGAEPVNNLFRFKLTKPVGPDIVNTDPANPLYKRVAALDVMQRLKTQGGTNPIKSAQLKAIAEEINESVRTGQALSKSEMNALIRKQEKVLAGSKVEFSDAAEGRVALEKHLQGASTPQEAAEAIHLHGAEYSKVLSKDEVVRRVQSRINHLEKVETLDNAVKLSRGLPEGMAPKDTSEYLELASVVNNAGVDMRPVTQGNKLQSIVFSASGQKVAELKSIKEARQFYDDIQSGVREVRNVHELRLKAQPRGTIVELSGKNKFTVSNYYSGEKRSNLSFKEAVQTVEDFAPEVAKGAPKIGLEVPGGGPVPGPGPLADDILPNVPPMKDTPPRFQPKELLGTPKGIQSAEKIVARPHSQLNVLEKQDLAILRSRLAKGEVFDTPTLQRFEELAFLPRKGDLGGTGLRRLESEIAGGRQIPVPETRLVFEGPILSDQAIKKAASQTFSASRIDEISTIVQSTVTEGRLDPAQAKLVKETIGDAVNVGVLRVLSGAKPGSFLDVVLSGLLKQKGGLKAQETSREGIAGLARTNNIWLKSRNPEDMASTAVHEVAHVMLEFSPRLQSLINALVKRGDVHPRALGRFRNGEFRPDFLPTESFAHTLQDILTPGKRITASEELVGVVMRLLGRTEAKDLQEVTKRLVRVRSQTGGKTY
jgi:hypothetical protein